MTSQTPSPTVRAALDIAATRFEKPAAIRVWSELDFEILRTLTWRLPLVDSAQAVALWGPDLPQPTGCWRDIIASRLERLRQAGWLERYRIAARRPPRKHAPGFRWRPGQERPDIRGLRRRARAELCSAIQGRPARLLTVYLATRTTANLFGAVYRGGFDADLLTQWLCWGQAYRVHCRQSPENAQHWNALTILQRGQQPQALPSHVCIRSGNGPDVLIGLLAHSSVRCLWALHNFCHEQSLEYELW